MTINDTAKDNRRVALLGVLSQSVLCIGCLCYLNGLRAADEVAQARRSRS